MTPERSALASTLRGLAAKPTDFTFAEISLIASEAAEHLDPALTIPSRVVGSAERSDGSLVEWEQAEISDIPGV